MKPDPKPPADVLLDEVTVQAALQRALAHGLSGTSARTATAVLAAWLFPQFDLSATHGRLQDLVYDLSKMIFDTQPSKLFQSLKAVLADLDFLAVGFEAGRRPRRTRRIGCESLIVLTGRLPCSLLPVDRDLDFSHFGRLQIGEPDPRNGPLIPIDRNSRLLRGILYLVSSRGRTMVVWPRSLSRWPRSLSALGLHPARTPQRAICADRIHRLSPDEKIELAGLASAAARWVRRCYGIRHHRDPLHFDPVRLVAPKATATILTEMTDIICPWPDRLPADEILERLREPRPCEADVHPEMQRSGYGLIFDLVRRIAFERSDARFFKARADAIGLIDPEAETETFDRFAENHVRTFVHVRMINEVRCHLEELFAKNGIDTADFEKSVDGFSPGDYHELGRWSDDLKGRLLCGLVDRSHGTSVRFEYSEASMWSFPSKLPRTPAAEQLVSLLVGAVRQGRGPQMGGG